ncbi:hypothetical protein IMG5_106000 [Ichthyophthirius multifiliis]|uniref:Ankyrin repeat protein n=1 Tax=Ichthyophthirius multifiliis TaxID=5932 RepID=G0QT43_ICHMU|nr:hypothetical protein IMG5_106000 [Ichthyophthirius multifiliis]EGR31618.1 hypothetical protein IMG5_106000 [Ichthyophthirius multifiliis]|eukprot:XP_004035104.1 hypothetical protein IMG5_106000 [Ichthyophthirius multifiliis]
MKKIKDQFQNTITHYWKIYKTDQIQRLYQKGKYEKIASNLKTFSQYNNIKINEYSFIFFLISEQNKSAIDKILQKTYYKANILSDYNNNSQITPLSFSILNNMQDMSDYLIQQGANLHQKNNEGNTILHIASFLGNLEALKFCLEKNVNINDQNNKGDTAILYAIIKQNIEIIQFLLKNGANITISNKDGFYPIHEATITGNIEILKLLINSLDFIRSQFPICDPVHLASQLDSVEILSFFIEKDKHLVNIQDKTYNQTPLHYAVNEKKYECARYLLINKADANLKDIHGNTPLHFATLNKDLNMIGLLEEFGGNALIKNDDGLSCIDVCYIDKDIRIINYYKTLNKYSQHFMNLYQ